MRHQHIESPRYLLTNETHAVSELSDSSPLRGTKQTFTFQSTNKVVVNFTTGEFYVCRLCCIFRVHTDGGNTQNDADQLCGRLNNIRSKQHKVSFYIIK